MVGQLASVSSPPGAALSSSSPNTKFWPLLQSTQIPTSQHWKFKFWWCIRAAKRWQPCKHKMAGLANLPRLLPECNQLPTQHIPCLLQPQFHTMYT